MASRYEHHRDGHHIVIDGRRWRATDPSIPDTFRTELVRELMDARRASRPNDRWRLVAWARAGRA